MQWGEVGFKMKQIILSVDGKSVLSEQSLKSITKTNQTSICLGICSFLCLKNLIASTLCIKFPLFQVNFKSYPPVSLDISGKIKVCFLSLYNHVSYRHSALKYLLCCLEITQLLIYFISDAMIYIIFVNVSLLLAQCLGHGKCRTNICWRNE